MKKITIRENSLYYFWGIIFAYLMVDMRIYNAFKKVIALDNNINIIILIAVFIFWSALIITIFSSMFFGNIKYVIDETGISSYNYKGQLILHNDWTEKYSSSQITEPSGRGQNTFLVFKFNNGNTYKLPWNYFKVNQIKNIARVDDALNTNTINARNFIGYLLVTIFIIAIIYELTYFL